MKISLIICVYKNINFLDLVMRSALLQSYTDFEVIVAEDNDSEEMADYIEKQNAESNVTIKHVFQKDSGFRKSKILNNAVTASDGDFIVFIDGDCLIHKEFLSQYAKQARENTCLFGRRVMLSRKLSDKFLHGKKTMPVNVLDLLFSGNKKIEEGFYLPFFKSFRNSGLKGCNIGLSKELLEKINGFDEDYEKPWGGEDTDLERRLRLAGAEFKCTKFKTIQYHLYHELISREDPEESRAFVDMKKRSTEWFCKNGLLKD